MITSIKSSTSFIVAPFITVHSPPISFAIIFARVVFPSPAEPNINTCSSGSPLLFAAAIASLSNGLIFSCPTYSLKVAALNSPFLWLFTPFSLNTFSSSCLPKYTFAISDVPCLGNSSFTSFTPSSFTLSVCVAFSSSICVFLVLLDLANAANSSSISIGFSAFLTSLNFCPVRNSYAFSISISFVPSFFTTPKSL